MDTMSVNGKALPSLSFSEKARAVIPTLCQTENTIMF